MYIVVERARDYMIQQILGSIEERETHHTAGINRVWRSKHLAVGKMTKVDENKI